MKVEGPSKSGGTQKSGKTKSTGKTSSKFDDMLVGGAEKTSAAQQLDTLKLSLLGGNLTIGQVVNIADMAASHREKIDDPEMTALLDEIDLRAQIELAKIRKALG